jgi:hypothetical protein
MKPIATVKHGVSVAIADSFTRDHVQKCVHAFSTGANVNGVQVFFVAPSRDSLNEICKLLYAAGIIPAYSVANFQSIKITKGDK